MKIRITTALVFVLAIGLVAAVLAGELKNHPLKNKAAPEFTLKDLNGKEWKLSSLRQKVVVLYFQRITCEPCRKAAGELQKLHKKHGEKGLQVLAVNLDPARIIKDVEKYVKDEKLTFPFLRDTDHKVTQAYKLEYIPHFVIIDRYGRVRYVYQGYEYDLAKVLEKEITPLLPKPK